jgi:hypothetical protein
VTWTVYDARIFYLDLTKELQRLHSPRYPERQFFLALEHANRIKHAAEWLWDAGDSMVSSENAAPSLISCRPSFTARTAPRNHWD